MEPKAAVATALAVVGVALVLSTAGFAGDGGILQELTGSDIDLEEDDVEDQADESGEAEPPEGERLDDGGSEKQPPEPSKDEEPDASGSMEHPEDNHDDEALEEQQETPERTDSPPEPDFWINPGFDPVEVEGSGDVTRLYPETPRTREEIEREMEELSEVQRGNVGEMDLPTEPLFEDHSDEWGVEFEHDPLDFSVVDATGGAMYFHYPAVAAADVDGDGNLDLYFLNQAGPNELWMNEGDGSFVERTEEAGVAVEDAVSSGAAFADVDNDGAVDLYVTTLGGKNRLFENQGDGTFEDVSQEAGVDYDGYSSSAVFFDHDGDGLLDLYVVNLANFTSEFEGESGFNVPSSRVAGVWDDWAEESKLYVNKGDWEFERKSTEADRPDSWDSDALLLPQPGSPPGLYVADIDGADGLYRNHGGTFTDRTSDEVGETPYGSFGGAVLDAGNTGEFEVFVTDKHSDMMGRTNPTELTREDKRSKMTREEFMEGMSFGGHGGGLHGSAYYTREGDGYVEEAEDRGVQSYLPWGPVKGDVNANGYLDLFVTAGMEYRWYMPDALMMNDGDGGFVRAEFPAGVHPREDRFHVWNTVDCDEPEKGAWCRLDPTGEETLDGDVEVMNVRSSRGSVLADLTGDGALDLVTTEFNGEPRFLENQVMQESDRGYLKMELRGESAPRDGIGAVATLHTDRDSYHRFDDGKAYLTQNQQPLYFGLQSGEEPRQVVVEWTTGESEVFDVTSRDNEVVLKQGEGR